jgi:ketosteroid isomerase-like protein
MRWPLLCLLVVAGCRSRPSPAPEIRAVLDQQIREWNNGNLAGFMDTYWKSEHTRFHSGGDVTVGWQTVFDRYRKRYSDRAAMGRLAFSDMEITPLAKDVAMATGKWQLYRAKDQTTNQAWGLFTLLLRKTPEGWRIVYDHTSSAEQR